MKGFAWSLAFVLFLIPLPASNYSLTNRTVQIFSLVAEIIYLPDLENLLILLLGIDSAAICGEYLNFDIIVLANLARSFRLEEPLLQSIIHLICYHYYRNSLFIYHSFIYLCVYLFTIYLLFVHSFIIYSFIHLFILFIIYYSSIHSLFIIYLFIHWCINYLIEWLIGWLIN